MPSAGKTCSTATPPRSEFTPSDPNVRTVDYGLLPGGGDEQTDVQSEEMLVNMGPQHPSTHGVLRIVLRTDGEMVLEAVPHLGYLHRCKEKIAENLAYYQYIGYTDRLDYLAAMNNNHAWAMAVEKLADVEVPLRAEYIRIIAVELNRIASHLVSFGTYGLDMGAFTPFLYAFREREMILDLFEEVCAALDVWTRSGPRGTSPSSPPAALAARTSSSAGRTEPSIEFSNGTSARSARPRKSGVRISMRVTGDNSRTRLMHAVKCPAPPSRKSSRVTLVITTCASPSRPDRTASVSSRSSDCPIGVRKAPSMPSSKLSTIPPRASGAAVVSFCVPLGTLIGGLLRRGPLRPSGRAAGGCRR